MLISKLEAGIPLAYITQTTSFYGREFYVDEHVLIPRQETELLCEMIINFINNNHIKKFCEVGVGSGVIAATLVAESNQNIDAIVTDISEAALSIARKNLQTHFENLDSFEFILCDRLRAVNEEFDLIISNPPYIKTIQDRASVHAQVLKYEPSIALFLDDEQYDKWFEDFFMMVNTRLKNNGRFYMEGHENHLYRQAGQITKLFDGSVEIVKDLTGRDRFLIWEKVNG